MVTPSIQITHLLVLPGEALLGPCIVLSSALRHRTLRRGRGGFSCMRWHCRNCLLPDTPQWHSTHCPDPKPLCDPPLRRAGSEELRIEKRSWGVTKLFADLFVWLNLTLISLPEKQWAPFLPKLAFCNPDYLRTRWESRTLSLRWSCRQVPLTSHLCPHYLPLANNGSHDCTCYPGEHQSMVVKTWMYGFRWCLPAFAEKGKKSKHLYITVCQYCSKHFYNIKHSCCTPYSNHKSKALKLFPLYRWANWDTERLGTLPSE